MGPTSGVGTVVYTVGELGEGGRAVGNSVGGVAVAEGEMRLE